MMKRKITTILVWVCACTIGWAQQSVGSDSINTSNPSGDNSGSTYVDPWKQIPEDPRTEIKTVRNITELKKLEADTEARLTLIYDTVLFASNGDVYVRDGSGCGAINFRDMKLNLEEGMVLIGSVVGRIVKDGKKAQFVATENTTSDYYAIIDKTPYVSPYIDIDIEEQDEYVDDVVVTGEVTIDSLPDAYGQLRLYAFKQRNGARLQLTDKYEFCSQPVKVPARCSGLRGVLSSNEDGNELYVLTDVSVLAQPTSIMPFRQDSPADNSACYTLSGQRASATFHGITITRNGKKTVR